MAVVERGFLHETLISAVILTVISATHPRPHGFLRRPRRTALARTSSPPLTAYCPASKLYRPKLYPPRTCIFLPVAHPFRGEAFRSASVTSPVQPQTQAQQPSPRRAETPVNYYSDSVAQAFRPEEPAFSAPLVTKPSPLPSAHSAHPIPATQSSPSAQPDKPPQSSPSTTKPTPTRNAYALHFDHNCRLLIDGKPF